MSNAAFLFYRNLFTVFIMLLLIFIQGKSFYIPDTITLVFAFGAAMLLPIFGRLTFLEAMRRINISRAVLITQSTPLFTALFAYIILNSVPTPTEWLGGAVIIAGVIIVKLQKDKTAAPIRY
jgi:drug/metabolite transporter (DMT)-like permease